MADYSRLIIPRSFNDYLSRVESQAIIDEQSQVTVEIGEITTVGEGVPASADNSGTNRNAIFNFRIPKGDKGDAGVIVESSGMYGLSINNNGELVLTYSGEDAPPIEINSDGELIYTY